MTSAMFCFKCGAQLVPTSAFCSTCGTPVLSSTTAPPMPPPVPSPILSPQATSETVVINRPGVVTFLAVLHFIGAAFWLLIGLGSIAANTAGAGAALVMAPVFLVIGGAMLFCGLGLLRLRPYGRTLQIVFAVIGLLAVPIGTAISILILIYFNKPGIKLIFQGRPGDDFTNEEVSSIRADTATSGATTVVIVIVSIVLVIITMGIVAAIAVPSLLRARQAGNEASAIASLRAITSGEVAYSASCGSGGFAVALEDLARTPTSGGDAFISADLGRSGVERNGYVLTLTRDASPIVGDVGTAAATCNGSTGQPASSYFATAEPVSSGATGSRYFAVDGRGTIYESSHPISNPIMNSTGIVPIR